MKFLTSILALAAIAGVSAMPTSNSVTTNTVTSGEFTYNGEGVVVDILRTSPFSAAAALTRPMQTASLGNANAEGTMVAGHAKGGACSASRDRALELAGPDLGGYISLDVHVSTVIIY
ncbi:hypothetical protein ANOM_005297, partial [Aspergillus nomiae NRRL 13137]